LVLEHDAREAEREARALRAAGFAVTCERVDSEPAFTACLESGTYDLVLSDYSLPAFDGMRALQMLRARGLDVPFVLVSGELGEETALECVKLGAADCVLKGHFDRLAAAVERALRDAGERRQRALAEAALRQSELKLRALVENARDLTGAVDLGAVLTRIVERTAKVLACDVVGLFGDGASLLDRLLAQYGISPDLLAAAEALRFARGEPFGGLLQRRETIRIADAETDTASYAALLRRFRLRSAVVTPVHTRGTHFGGLVAATSALRPFDREQVDLCEAVARQIAAALDATELQRKQREEAQIAAALARVGQELMASVDQSTLLARLCRVTTEVLGCDVAYTLMLSDDRRTFITVASYGGSAEQHEILPSISVPQRAFEAVVEHAAPDEVVEYERARHAHPLPSELRDIPGLCAALALRLLRGTELIGVHVAGNRAGHAGFAGLHRRIARGIAELASLALDHARVVHQLEDANRLKSDFLATVSHELRTPLDVIVGYNDLLLDEAFGPLTTDQHTTLERIGGSARELLELIGATLDVSRLETGRAALNLQEIDTPAVLRAVQVETQMLRDKPGVESRWRIDERLPPLYSDAVKIKVLLKNVIANAMKFTDHGSVTVAAAAHDGWLELSVSDTGIGMSQDTQAVIFEPFRQGDSSTPRRHGGVGLGLYIVSRLLSLLGGRIEVESTLGCGSTFRMWIPVRCTSPSSL
jgi:signal transduction histidine kinase/DNA-binding response OmpR family regulator